MSSPTQDNLSREYRRAFGVYLNSKITQMVVLDISNMQLLNVSKYFQKLSVVVFDSFYNKEVAIDLFRYLSEMEGNELTIQQWLDTKNNVPLVTSDEFPDGQYLFASYSDIQYKGFSLFPGDASKSKGEQSLLLAPNARDIRVQRTDGDMINYSDLVNKCLWTINGHMVRAVNDDEQVYLLGAGKHYRVNDNIHVGCINFNYITDLSTPHLTDEMLDIDIKYDTVSIHITVPDQELDNKKIWMSLGGRLLFDGVISKVGGNVVKLDLSRIDLVNRIFESLNYIDLEPVISKERVVIDADFYKSESNLRKLLTHMSSFLIILDNPYMNVQVTPVRTYQYPYTYYTEDTYPHPMMLQSGLIPKYFTRKLGHNKLMDIDLGCLPKYLIDTTGINNEGNLYHNKVSRAEPYTLNQGYLLKIKAMV